MTPTNAAPKPIAAPSIVRSSCHLFIGSRWLSNAQVLLRAVVCPCGNLLAGSSDVQADQPNALRARQQQRTLGGSVTNAYSGSASVAQIESPALLDRLPIVRQIWAFDAKRRLGPSVVEAILASREPPATDQAHIRVRGVGVV